MARATPCSALVPANVLEMRRISSTITGSLSRAVMSAYKSPLQWPRWDSVVSFQMDLNPSIGPDCNSTSLSALRTTLSYGVSGNTIAVNTVSPPLTKTSTDERSTNTRNDMLLPVPTKGAVCSLANGGLNFTAPDAERSNS